MKRIYLSSILLTLLFGILACGRQEPAQSEVIRASTTTTPITFLKTDADVIENLKKHHRLKPKEMGGGGRCLFHSLRAQITEAELVSKKARWPHAITINVDRYSTLDANAQANLLREIALWEEKDLLVTKGKKDIAFEKLNPDEQDFGLEMAKDWHQELESNIPKTREWFSKNIQSTEGKQDLWNYVITHKDSYWAKTSCETNWAGSAEAIALARALERPLMMFGRDEVSDERGAKVDAEGKVLPYTHYQHPSSSAKALLVFQCGGGGHYQMLEAE